MEDTSIVAVELKRTLERAGFCVLGPHATLDSALAAVRGEQEIEAALLDINLSGRLVFPVADELSLRHVPFAFLTGYVRDHIPATYQSAESLEKPFTAKEMLAVLQRMLNRVQAPRGVPMERAG